MLRTETILFKDTLIHRWCLEDKENEPPRLCVKDLEDPERFRRRLAEWIRAQC